MRATVVIPTYNERENIGPLLDHLRSLSMPDLSVLVVDDSSPDGTGDRVRARAATDAWVTLLTREKKEGLGRAYSAAFRHIEGTPETPDAVLQMDADLSHDPADVPKLLAALETADLVIGSRYVRGGRTKNWTLARRALSRSANAYARACTGVPLRDFTGGFNAWRASLLSAVQPETIRAEGYGYLIELKVRASRLGARMKEVPITFTERRTGTSKLSKRVIFEAAGVVLKLGVQRTRRGTIPE